MAGCAQRLKVLQGALSSSAVDGPDVVHLPELPFRRVPYHLIQLSKRKVRHPRTLQKFLPLTHGRISDAEIKLLGVLMTKLANAVFNLKHFSPEVALTGANGEVLLAGVRAEARVPGLAARLARGGRPLTAEAERVSLAVQGLQVAFGRGGAFCFLLL